MPCEKNSDRKDHGRNKRRLCLSSCVHKCNVKLWYTRFSDFNAIVTADFLF
jgi:hypothetical protein